ncbi:conserved hypothetical protein [Luminiphilus syltensis NOR5-1B]|uniref:Tryptophan synthase subunit beta like protein n=1 Tax=Luminiphilus syltensis NOR5-1B TaxID=565045 RepID=B8KRF8_9GAMM|nr:hypothetical protein [Luminiphilus syltensis]EED36159.1 conserved hypothetical protein [Luminiphilus syltensis NOR5-1B]
MAFVKRNSDGEIIAVSKAQEAGFEAVADDDALLLEFLQAIGSESPNLVQSDLDFVRVIEDLLEVLMDKNILMFTDLPPEAQQKIMKRKALRKGGNSLDLLDDGPLI